MRLSDLLERRETQAHLSEETLAQIADHGIRGRHPPHVVRHLAACRSCMAAYCDAVRYRTALGFAPDWFAQGTPPRQRRLPLGLLVPIAAGLLLTLGLVVTRVGWRRAPVIAGGDFSAFTELLEHASVRGLVLPGGEQHWPQGLVVYRGSANVLEPSAPLLERLQEKFGKSQHGAEPLYQLAATLTASRRFGAANDYITEGLAEWPEDSRFVVLSAVLARERGQLAEAAALLGRAAARHPEDPLVALDLAVVQLERGDPAGARRLLDDLNHRSLPPLLAERAAELRSRAGPK
jgi:hypothetical protein